MAPTEDRDARDDGVAKNWTGETWTGEPDTVAAIALAACLFVAGLVFLVLASGELHH